MNFTAIDFETANPKRTSACSIGMAKVRDGKIVDTFYELLKPYPEDFHYINTSIHGITPEMVANSKTLLDLWDEIGRFIDGDVLVAHNVSFEQSVINQYMLEHQMPTPDFDYLCTLYMSKVRYPRRVGYKLDDVCKDILGRTVNHHHALEDAIACAELAAHLIEGFPKQPLKELMGALYVTPQREKNEWKKLTGIKPTREELDPHHPFFDQRIVITGVLSTMSRERAVQLLVDCGGLYQDTLTKSTNYLLIGDEEKQIALFGSKSVKAKKAEEYNAKGSNIQILNEQEFMKLIVP